MLNLLDFPCGGSLLGSIENFVPMNYKFIFHHYQRANKRRQLLLSVSQKGKRKRIPLGVYLLKSEYDIQKQMPTNVCPNDYQLIIKQIESKINEIFVQYRLSDKPLTLDRFVFEFKNGFQRTDFIAFMHKMIEMETHLNKSTLKRHLTVWNKLKEKHDTLYFSEINIQWADKYIEYLTRLGNNGNTVHSNFRVIKKYLRKAAKYGIKFPLDLEDVKIKVSKSQRINLTKEEVKKLWDYYHSDFFNKKYEISLGVFLFGCFTSLRISDLKNIQRSAILERDIYDYTVQKTNKPHSIRLNESAKKLVKENPLLFNQWISEQKINEHLKEISKTVGIQKNVSLHVARHSFATNYLRVGGKVEVLQRIMGHSTINQTMTYVHIVNAEQDDSILLLDSF